MAAWFRMGLLAVALVVSSASAREDDVKRGIAALKEKKYDSAVSLFTSAIKADPKDHQAYLGRGIAYFSKNDYDSAITDYTEALRLNPKAAKSDVYHQKTAEAYYRRGAAAGEEAEYAKAVKDYREAIRLHPDYVGPNNNLAWLLATCPKGDIRDGKKAIEHATKACELTKSKNPRTLGTLAAAYAEDGQFALAVKWQKTALDTPGLTEQEIKADRERLKLYEQGKPARVN